MTLHVELFGFAMQSDLGLLGWLVKSVYALYFICFLSLKIAPP